jgi:hypothetical protein
MSAGPIDCFPPRRVIVTATDLDIRDLTCERDAVTACIQRGYISDFQADVESTDEIRCGNIQDISLVRSYAFYFDNFTPDTKECFFELAVDDTNFLRVQTFTVTGGATIVIPSIKNPDGLIVTGPERVSVGYPLPGKKARLCFRGPGRVNLAFAAWL